MGNTNKLPRTGGTGSGSGRTTGSFSFVILTLAQLNKKFADENTPIKVGRKWAEELGFDVSSAPAGKLTTQITAAKEVESASRVMSLNDL